MRYHPSQRHIVWTVLFSILAALALNACGDVSNVSGPPPPATPGPLTILTPSPLPGVAQNQTYTVALSASGGTPGYTWSLVAGSPPLPTGLTLSPGGIISGSPTSLGTVDLIFKVQDSATPAISVQETLSITVSVAPIPLQITSISLSSGTINVPYFAALTGTGGTTPYTWGLKSGSPSLPPGLTLDTVNGFIQGTPTQTGSTTPIFTLRDATLLTVEKSLTLTIDAVPLSITTNSLPQGTANQNYSAQLAATGGTGAYTWGLAGGSPALPTGLTLNTSSGLISGIPTGTSSLNHTFTVTDHTPPSPQTATKTLQLIIGAQTPNLIITTNSPLPPGTVTQPYNNVTLTSSGGTGTKTWDTSSGSLPAGLSLSASGVISGTPQASGTSSPTFRVRDSGNPQDTATKQLSITINLPAALNITTPSPLPNGVLNQPYNQTVQATGGSGTRNWSFSGGNIPNLTIGLLTGVIAGNPTPTGQFTFTVQVTDALFTDTKDFTITITAPPAPQIMTSSLPTGTVNVPYPSTTITATGGAPPLNFQPIGLPFGLSFNVTPNSSTATITGTPTSNGSQNVTFTVNDSTVPFNQTGTRTLPLTVNAALTIDTPSPLPSGTKDSPYSFQLAASGGTPLPGPTYSWSLASGSPALPPGLGLNPSGLINGKPTNTINVTVTPKFRVQDAVPTAVTKDLTITVNATLTIDTPTPLPAGKVGDAYSTPLSASGGTGPGTYTWILASDSPNPILPDGLALTSDGVLSGTPGPTTARTYSLKFTVEDLTSPTPQSLSTTLSLTIDSVT